MSEQCESQKDTYRYEKGKNVLVLTRCVLRAGHANACDASPCEQAPFCEHRHTDGKRSGWPTANQWRPGDPNQGDLWDAFSRAVSTFPHDD